MNKTKETIIEYGKKLTDIGFSIGDSPRILVRKGLHVYSTQEGADLSTLDSADILNINGSADAAKGALIASSYNAMIITSPYYASMCIQDNLAIPAVLDDMAMIVGNRVRIVPGERLAIAKALKKSSAVMTTDGKVLTCGRNLYEALTCLTILEKNAGIFVDADFLGGAKPVCRGMGKLEHLIYQQKYSKKEMERQNQLERPDENPTQAITPMDSKAENRNCSDAEWDLRNQIVDYGKELTKTGLVQGTWGNLSARLDDTSMLCTPSGMDYEGLNPEDIVKVNMETLEYEGNLKPTSEKDFHAGIYQNRPDVNGIIHTHSRYACVFASCGLSFTTTSGDAIECAAYGPSGTGILSKNVQKAVGENKGCLMKNHGMVAVGMDLEDAFHTARSIENAAKARIQKYWEE